MSWYDGTPRKIRRVFLHCSASDNPEHDDISVIRKWHAQRGFTDVGYHWFIKKDGTVQAGRSVDQIPAAQQGHNTGTLAICLHGLDKLKFTEAQFESLRALCREINTIHQGKVTFHGHCEVSSKTCPVFDYRKVLHLSPSGHI